MINSEKIDRYIKKLKFKLLRLYVKFFRNVIKLMKDIENIIQYTISFLRELGVKIKSKFSLSLNNIKIALIQKKIVYNVKYLQTKRKLTEKIKSTKSNIADKVTNIRIRRQSKKNFNTFLKKQELYSKSIENHVGVYNTLTDLLQVTYSMVDFEVSKLIGNGYLIIRVESEEFIQLTSLFIERFKTLVGINIYNIYCEWWGNETAFLEYLTSWLYRRITLDFRTIAETTTIERNNSEEF